VEGSSLFDWIIVRVLKILLVLTAVYDRYS
jgi:hypothetical protein